MGTLLLRRTPAEPIEGLLMLPAQRRLPRARLLPHLTNRLRVRRLGAASLLLERRRVLRLALLHLPAEIVELRGERAPLVGVHVACQAREPSDSRSRARAAHARAWVTWGDMG